MRPDQSDPMISVHDLVVSYGETIAVSGVSFDVRRGEHVTLLGPSGCGKTTTLRTIAGLERPTSGTISIEGRVVFSSTPKVNIPAEKRGVSMMFQSYAIWPHMTVFENVAYGLRVRHVVREELHTKVHQALDLVRMKHLADRPASKLSGGQQQRVALARAIAFSPNVVLFDEPLSNLDAKLRASMRVELRELQQKLGVTSVYVTHDQEEALAISDRVIVMNVGKIEQIGTPSDIYDRPRSTFVADFVGSANVISGKIVGARRDPGPIVFESISGERLKAWAFHSPRGHESKVAVRTAHVSITEGAAPAGDGNSLTGTIHRRMFHGDFVEYLVRWRSESIVVRRPPVEILPEGAPVMLSFAEKNCVLLDG